MSNPQEIYTPFDTGHYRFSAGLRSLGEGTPIFECDDRFDHYIETKRAVADKLPDQHIGQIHSSDQQIEAANRRIAGELNLELPDTPPFETFCSFAMRMQEDLAIMHVPEKGHDRLVAVHVCAPSGWSPKEVLGQSFLGIHAPIPEFDAVNRAAPSMMRSLTREGAKERFVWGINFTPNLNRSLSDHEWKPFNPENPKVYVRVERQCMIGLPEADAFLFTIRTYLYNAMEFSPELRAKLRDALKSWTPAMRQYKGVSEDLDNVVEFLKRELGQVCL